MPFTNVWDVTQPPDTQPANQLGLDIRNLKLDTMQRMAAISGVFANRPTPETINADWTGLLYFSLDTNQVFQWDGATWNEVTSNIGSSFKDYDDFANKSFAAVAPASIRILNLPIGAVQNANPIGSIIEIETAFQITASTGLSPSYTLKVNGTTVLSVSSASFTVAGCVVRVRATVILSNGANPRVVAELRTNADSVAPVVVNTVLPAAITGAAAVPIQDLFGASTTITANAFYMHARVRK